MEHFMRLAKEEWQTGFKKKLVLYIHGKGGCADESAYYRQFFDGWDIYGFDYKSENPWDAKSEFSCHGIICNM